MMTLQEVFNTVVIHLLTQMKKSAAVSPLSRYGGSSCFYRGPRGLKCAIGVLIPDAKYSERLEGRGIRTSGRWNPDIVDILRSSGVPASEGALLLLYKLQNLHDGSDPEVWEKDLRELAKEYELAMPTVPHPDEEFMDRVRAAIPPEAY